MDNMIENAKYIYSITKSFWIKQYKDGFVSREKVFTRMSAYLECMIDNGLCKYDYAERKRNKLEKELDSNKEEHAKAKALRKYERSKEEWLKYYEDGLTDRRTYWMRLSDCACSLVQRGIITKEELQDEYKLIDNAVED